MMNLQQRRVSGLSSRGCDGAPLSVSYPHRLLLLINVTLEYTIYTKLG